jgi:hypothetical protein
MNNPLQDLLDTETVMARLGFPVDAAAYSAAIEHLRSARTADEVCKAWNAIAGSIGPTLTAEILSCDDWRLIERPTRPLDDFDSDDNSQAVWVDYKAQVIGRAEMDGDRLVAVRFAVEAR